MKHYNMYYVYVNSLIACISCLSHAILHRCCSNEMSITSFARYEMSILVLKSYADVFNIRVQKNWPLSTVLREAA